MSQEFKKYPIYEFKVWVRDNYPGSCREQTLSGRRMYASEPTVEQLLEDAQKYADAQLERKDWVIDLGEDHKPERFLKMSAAEAGLAILAAAVSTPIYESWVLGWFSHSTIDAGEGDAYFYASFADYVSRMERFNMENRELVSFKDGSGHYWVEPVALMGAEDRWRWSSVVYPEDFDPNNPDDFARAQKDHDQIPCRCRFCKERGVVTISH